MSDIKLSATAISIDPESVKQLVDQAVENSILGAVSTLGTDPEWISKIDIVPDDLNYYDKLAVKPGF